MQPVDETIQNLQQILISNYENSVQPKNRQAIAAEYGIHVSTLRRLIKNKCPEISSRAALLPTRRHPPALQPTRSTALPEERPRLIPNCF
jgi:hypothetical protein